MKKNSDFKQFHLFTLEPLALTELPALETTLRDWHKALPGRTPSPDLESYLRLEEIEIRGGQIRISTDTAIPDVQALQARLETLQPQSRVTLRPFVSFARVTIQNLRGEISGHTWVELRDIRRPRHLTRQLKRAA